MTSGDNPDGGRHGFWQKLWRPSRRWWLLFLPAGGVLAFIGGIVVWFAVQQSMLNTSKMSYCLSCHEMRIPYKQYKTTVHYQNKYGVRAGCSDCHDPGPHHEFLMIEAKIKEAVFRDIPHHLLGTINTPEKFEKHKLAMAKYVWKEMRANNSLTCRNCHSYEAMKSDAQSHLARVRHSKAYREHTGKTCIDCHQGIAHELPKIGG